MSDSKRKRQKRSRKARKIIRCFYTKQFSLQHYLHMVDNTLSLRDKADTQDYRRLLASTLVAIPRSQAVMPSQKPRNTQWCTTNEIVHRVIETACNSKSGSSNILARGYERLSGNNKRGMVMGTHGIENSYPNTIVSYLKTTQSWQTLHKRIGDDLMIHLLQNLALFVKMPSRSYLQIAGHPISSLSSFSTENVCHLKSTGDSRKIASSLLSPGDTSSKQDCAARISKTFHHPVEEDSLKKRRKRRGGKRWKASSRQPYIPATPQQDSTCSADFTAHPPSTTHETSLEAREHENASSVRNSSLSNNQASRRVTETGEGLVQPINDDTGNKETTATRRGKRKAEDREDDGEEKNGDGDAPCSKKRKEHTGGESNPEDVTVHNDSLASLSHLGQVVVVNSVSSGDPSLIPKGMDLRELKRKHDSNDGAEGQGKQDASGGERTVQMARKRGFCLRVLPRRLRRRRLLTKILGKSKRVAAERRKTAKENPRKSENQGTLGGRVNTRPIQKKSINEAKQNRTYFPRSQLFFSSNLGQNLPRRHVLEVTRANQRGARHLIREIFLETAETKDEKTGKRTRFPANKEPNDISRKKKKGIGFQSSSSSTANTGSGDTVFVSKKRKPERLPKRLRGLQGLFLRFLARHKSCPFRILLRCHCPYKPQTPEQDKKVRSRRKMAKVTKPGKEKDGDEDGKLKNSKIGTSDLLIYRRAANNYTPYHKVSFVIV